MIIYVTPKHSHKQYEGMSEFQGPRHSPCTHTGTWPYATPTDIDFLNYKLVATPNNKAQTCIVYV